jgi:hypothetical protein
VAAVTAGKNKNITQIIIRFRSVKLLENVKEFIVPTIIQMKTEGILHAKTSNYSLETEEPPQAKLCFTSSIFLPKFLAICSELK